MAQILIVKPGTLTKADKAKLRAVDVVAIEADDPSSVKLITPEGAELGGSEMLWAAMKALTSKSGASAAEQRAAFALMISKVLDDKRAEMLKGPSS